MPANFPDDRLREAILSLVRKYEQETAIIKYADFDAAFLLRNEAPRSARGAWSKDRLAQFYTRMRYGPDALNRSFTFEHADDTTGSTKMAMHSSRG
jgi:hypothetical protein